MSVQRLHAFEKTAIQARHTIKRLEVLADVTKSVEEKEIADALLAQFHHIRKIIPAEYIDVDLQNKE